MEAEGCDWVGCVAGTEDRNVEASPETAAVRGLAIEKKEVADEPG